MKPLSRHAGLFVGLLLAAGSGPAIAERISNKNAVFAALDKVTARIQRLDSKLGETKQFGALLVTPRVCYSRPATETPKTTAFVEVDELMLDGSKQRIFSGWMFAESPGLHAVQHPVFDIWLTGCESPANGDAPVAAAADPAAADAAADPAAADQATADAGALKKKRRVKRQ